MLSSNAFRACQRVWRSALRPLHCPGRDDQGPPPVKGGIVEPVAGHQFAQLPANCPVGQFIRGHHDAGGLPLDQVSLGFPVAAGDPKMPRMSSRIWNASPMPHRSHPARPAPARHSPPSPRRSPGPAHRVVPDLRRATSSTALQRGQLAYIDCQIGELAHRELGTHGVVARPHPDEVAVRSPPSRSICSAQIKHIAEQDGGRFTDRREDPENLRWECQSANWMWPAGRPRRDAESSITSSCSRANACSSSRLAVAVSAASLGGAPHSQPRYINVERRYLLPSTNFTRMSAATSTPARAQLVGAAGGHEVGHAVEHHLPQAHLPVVDLAGIG